MPELLSEFGSVSTRSVHFDEILLLLVELKEGVGLDFDVADFYLHQGSGSNTKSWAFLCISGSTSRILCIHSAVDVTYKPQPT